MTCALPAGRRSIDWIFAAGQARFSYYLRDKYPQTAGSATTRSSGPGTPAELIAYRSVGSPHEYEQRQHADSPPLPPTAAAGSRVLGASLYGVLRAEATLARKAIGTTDGPGARRDRVVRPGPARAGDQDRPAGRLERGRLRRRQRRADPGRLAGLGRRRARRPPGAPARVRRRRRPVERSRASRSTKALLTDPDVAVILIGANDVTHTVLPAASVRFLSEAVRRLREADVAVVVGTCPDLGTVSPLPPPLRQVARVWSRRLAAAQTIAVVEAGGRTVSLGSILGPEFAAAPALLFGPDQFHPSAAGYEAARPAAGALGALRARRWARWRRRRRASAAARPCSRSATRRSRPARTPAPRSTAPRSAAPSAASAAAGSP